MSYRPTALSVSAVQLYAECPAKYHRRYVERLLLPASPAMAFGKAFHSALDAEHRGQDSDLALLAAWDANQADLDASGQSVAPGKVHGLKLLALYRERGLGGKMGEPEKKFWLPLPTPAVPVPIVGYIDLPIPERRRFREFKTTLGASWTATKIALEYQLHVYGWAYQRLYYHRPECAEYVIFGTGVPSVDVIESAPTPHGLRLFELAAEATWRGVVEQRFTGCGSCDVCTPAAEKVFAGPSFTWAD
jgi:hypothetical protein